ncbi:hypothetical protein [Clostridium sp.]|uniref:hypothetical protein n=1 Tax=Clostridium sp. TaxID=1506 RepID=UPI00290F9EB8|nr:hypothetical protein [Clostridium sp.]MDU3410095.1 hypothetical protein [Clostridium sp.]
MNTTFEEVFECFLSKIREYDYMRLSEEELTTELTQKLKSAFAKADFKNVELDLLMSEFTRSLSTLEIEALSYWLVYEWINPRVNNVELFKYRLGSKDYERFSEANHLKELMNIRSDSYNQARYYSNKCKNRNMTKDLL